MTQLKDGPLAVLAAPVLETLTRTEIESQMKWAYDHPRNLAKVKAEAMEMATIDEDTAAGCFYSLPARGGTPIEGPSVRLAEIIASTWTNMRAASRIIEIGQSFVTAQGVCHDLEKNVCRSVEVKRRITNKNHVRYSEDMIGVTCNAAMSIAFRNAVFQVVPMLYTHTICRAARAMAIGSAETLGKRRQEMVSHYQKMGVHAALVLQSIGRDSIDDVTLKDLETLVGIANAIKDGDMSVDEAFPGVSDTKEKAQTLSEHVEQEQAKAAEPVKPKPKLEGPPPEAEQPSPDLVKHRNDIWEMVKKLNDKDKEECLRLAGMKSVDDVLLCNKITVLSGLKTRVIKIVDKPEEGKLI